ncbi:MAG: integration host factor subunit alpha [Desulfamplus sp.]|nr:integration host factor subunit alpha [Desulfamplus sp.]
MQVLTKAQITDSIYERLKHSDYNKPKCIDMVETLLEIIKRTLESGENVMISKFGKFQVKHKKQRRGRNPATGDAMMLPARRVVTFKCSGGLRDKLNGKPKEWWEK